MTRSIAGLACVYPGALAGSGGKEERGLIGISFLSVGALECAWTVSKWYLL